MRAYVACMAHAATPAAYSQVDQFHSVMIGYDRISSSSHYAGAAKKGRPGKALSHCCQPLPQLATSTASVSAVPFISAWSYMQRGLNRSRTIQLASPCSAAYSYRQLSA